MKSFVLATATLVAAASPLFAAAIVDFEDLAFSGATPNYENGEHLSGNAFTSRGASLNNNYSGGFWSGFAYSNLGDTATSGFGNQYSSYAGGGLNAAGGLGGKFALGFGDAFSIVPTLILPTNTFAQSLRITNSTYAALSMRQGDSFAKKFGGATGNDPDFFKLTITGLNASNVSVGTVDFYLADYRFANNAQDYIVSTWTEVDLTSLGNSVRRLQFALSSSDVGQFGMNTPAYFAIDDVKVVPEPGTAMLLVFGALALARRRRF